jgi:protease-4
MLNIDQPLTPEQREIMQSVADECYNQFTQIVADGRKLPLETVKTLADGRIYTAQQALQNKLIDEILTYEEAKTQMNENFPDLKNLTFSEFRYTKEKNFYNFIFDMYSKAKGSTSKSNLVEKIIAEYSQMDYPAYLYVK